MATNRNRMYVALDEMTLAMEHASFRLTRATDKRLRLAGAVTIVLFLHVCFLWVLINTHSDTWKITEMVEEDLPLPIELWSPTPEPPVVPIEQPVVKPETEPQPQPQQQQEPVPSPAPKAAPPQPVIQPAPTPAVVVPQDKPVPVVAPVAAPQPVPAPEPALPNLKIKKKTDEVIQKKAADQVGNPTTLNLHEVQASDVPSLAGVPSSGLSPKPSAPAAPGGRLGAMQNQGLPGGLSGAGLNGRGQLTQAMQNHDYCVAQQTAGKPIPANCDMPALTGMKSQGLKHDAGLQAAVAKKDANARYTQAAGNSDYWKRVNHVPTTSDRSDDLPKQGSYTSAKDQRVMGGGGKTADTGPQ